MRDFIGTGLSDSESTRNVVNILRVLTEDKGCVAYIPYGYVAEKEGKSSDPRVHFFPKDSGRPVQIIDVQSNQERFNFSVRCLVDVKVEFPQDDGTIVLRNMKVWRTYTVVRDGALLINKICAKLSKEAYEDLSVVPSLLSIGDAVIDSRYRFDPEAIYGINLEGLPIVSSNWARPNALGFHKMLRDASRMEEQLKQMRKILKENSNTAHSPADSSVYMESISNWGHSSGVEANCVSYSIRELPGYVADKVESADKESFDLISSKLSDFRFRCACIKWAMECSVTHRKSPYEWSETYQKKSGSNKFYSECEVQIDGVSYILERCEYTKKF